MNTIIRRPPTLANLLGHKHFHAARRAVLTPYDGTLARVGRSHVPTVMYRMWEEWCQVLARLGEAGWDGLQKAEPGFLANCPYFGVKGHGWAPCNHALICPFCWGRCRVVRPYCRIADRLPRSRTVRSLYQLVEFDATYRTPYTQMNYKGGISELDDLTRLLKTARDRIALEGRLEVNANQHSGAFVCHSVDLDRAEDDPSQHTFVSRRRGVFLLSNGWDVVRLPRVRYRIHKVSRRNLVAIVGRVCRYPVGWLKYADGEQVCKYLTAWKRCRTLRFVGDWFGKAPKCVFGDQHDSP